MFRKIGVFLDEIVDDVKDKIEEHNEGITTMIVVAGCVLYGYAVGASATENKIYKNLINNRDVTLYKR